MIENYQWHLVEGVFTHKQVPLLCITFSRNSGDFSLRCQGMAIDTGASLAEIKQAGEALAADMIELENGGIDVISLEAGDEYRKGYIAACQDLLDTGLTEGSSIRSWLRGVVGKSEYEWEQIGVLQKWALKETGWRIEFTPPPARHPFMVYVLSEPGNKYFDTFEAAKAYVESQLDRQSA